MFQNAGGGVEMQKASPAKGWSVNGARTFVGLTWIVGAMAIFLMLGSRAICGSLAGLEDTVKSWLSNIFPILSLVLTGYGTHNFTPPSRIANISRGYWCVAVSMSTAYLFLAIGPLAVDPWVKTELKDLLESTKAYMGLFQGIVISVLVRLYIVKDPEQPT